MATPHPPPNNRRELYFHIQGGHDLSLMKASEDLTWKHCIQGIKPPHGQVCYLVQCGAKTTTLRRDKCISEVKLKDQLKDFIKKHKDSAELRFEARFGHLFFIHTDHDRARATQKIYIDTDSLKKKSVKKQFVVRLHTSDIEDFIQENCDTKVTDEPQCHTFKITFVVNGVLEGKCAVKESGGRFTHCYTHTTSSRTDEMILDISRPGRPYDIRLDAVNKVSISDKEKVSDRMKGVSEEIVRSMKRSPNGEIRMQLVGENFHVEFIREKSKTLHHWKLVPWLVLTEFDIHQFTLTPENCERDRQFCDIPIKYDTSHKEIELRSNIQDITKQKEIEKWISDESPGADNFEVFVGTCFDIASKLDDIASTPRVS